MLEQNGIAQPTIRVAGTLVPVTSVGDVHLSALRHHRWQSLTVEWTTVRERCPWAMLPDFSLHVGIITALRFVDLRIRASDGLGPDHWIQKLRAMLLRMSAWLLEIAVDAEFQDASTQFQSRPTELYGAGGKRRAPHQDALKLSICQQICHYGSREAITRSLGRGKGTAAQLSSCMIRLYMANVRQVFQASASVAVHWDGSTHDGHDVQVGAALLPATTGKNAAALLPPVAHP